MSPIKSSMVPSGFILAPEQKEKRTLAYIQKFVESINYLAQEIPRAVQSWR